MILFITVCTVLQRDQRRVPCQGTERHNPGLGRAVSRLVVSHEQPWVKDEEEVDSRKSGGGEKSRG